MDGGWRLPSCRLSCYLFMALTKMLCRSICFAEIWQSEETVVVGRVIAESTEYIRDDPRPICRCLRNVFFNYSGISFIVIVRNPWSTLSARISRVGFCAAMGVKKLDKETVRCLSFPSAPTTTPFANWLSLCPNWDSCGNERQLGL